MKIRRKYLTNILVCRKIVLTNNMIDRRTVLKYHLINFYRVENMMICVTNRDFISVF